jgi:hypothetical protein
MVAIALIGAASLAVLIAWAACRVSSQCSQAEETTFTELQPGEFFQIDTPELTLTFRKLEGDNRALCLQNNGPAMIHAGCPVTRVEGL